MHTFLKSKFFITVGSALLILMVFFLGRELYRKYEIDREIKNIENQISSLESKNKDILKTINYLRTREYKERQARSLLNLQKPGEFVVALPGGEEERIAGAEESGAGDKTKENLIKWWNYFFSDKR